MSVEISVRKEFESPENFMQLGKLGKKAVNSSLNLKALHSGKDTESLSDSSLKLKDLLSFENILSKKVLENKNAKNEGIKSLAKFTEKDKTHGNKEDNALNHLFPWQTAIKPESLTSVSLKDIESKNDKEIKEKSSVSKNILLQLFEKSLKEKNIFNSLNYHLNQNSSLEKTVNLKESNELKKEREKKEFFKIVDLRKSSGAKRAESFKLSEKESSEISQANKSAFSGNNMNHDNVDMKELNPASQTQLSSGKFQQFENSLISPKNGIASFHNQFLEHLRESGNADIVKNANIILKENNAGEIKLLMKPESLGYVRIKLMLEGDNIAGKIIVDNNSVKEIFESNLDNLIKNFKESGYSGASIDVSVGGEQKNRERQSVENDRLFALKEIERVDEHTISRNILAENRLVDMVI